MVFRLILLSGLLISVTSCQESKPQSIALAPEVYQTRIREVLRTEVFPKELYLVLDSPKKITQIWEYDKANRKPLRWGPENLISFDLKKNSQGVITEIQWTEKNVQGPIPFTIANQYQIIYDPNHQIQTISMTSRSWDEQNPRLKPGSNATVAWIFTYLSNEILIAEKANGDLNHYVYDFKNQNWTRQNAGPGESFIPFTGAPLENRIEDHPQAQTRFSETLFLFDGQKRLTAFFKVHYDEPNPSTFGASPWNRMYQIDY